MSTAAIAFLTFLGGSAVGAIGAAGVTAWHNGTERLRDRMIAAAELFLVAVEEAQNALWAEREAAHELFEAASEMTDLSDQLAPAAVPGQRGDAPDSSRPPAPPASYQQAMRSIQRLSLDGQHNPLDTSRRAEAAVALGAAAEAVRRAEDDLADTPFADLATGLREWLRHQSRNVTALQSRGDKTRCLIGCVYRVHSAVARVGLSFPATESGLSEVADRADLVKALLSDAASAINQAMIAKSDPYGDPKTDRLLQELNVAQGEFARAANLEIGKRRWPWKKYGDQN